MAMANAEEHASESRLEDTGFSVDGREGGAIESATAVSGGSWDDRPPVSFAETDHILVRAPPRSSSNAICRSACTGSTADLYPPTPLTSQCGRYVRYIPVGVRSGSGRQQTLAPRPKAIGSV